MNHANVCQKKRHIVDPQQGQIVLELDPDKGREPKFIGCVDPSTDTWQNLGSSDDLAIASAVKVSQPLDATKFLPKSDVTSMYIQIGSIVQVTGSVIVHTKDCSYHSLTILLPTIPRSKTARNVSGVCSLGIPDSRLEGPSGGGWVGSAGEQTAKLIVYPEGESHGDRLLYFSYMYQVSDCPPVPKHY